MDLDFDDEATRKLRWYALQVTEALGLQGESSSVEAEHPSSLYLAVEGRLPRFPDEDLALVWRERRGWFAVTERPGGSHLREVARFGGAVNAPARTVAEWVTDLLHDQAPRLPRTA